MLTCTSYEEIVTYDESGVAYGCHEDYVEMLGSTGMQYIYGDMHSFCSPRLGIAGEPLADTDIPGEKQDDSSGSDLPSLSESDDSLCLGSTCGSRKNGGRKRKRRIPTPMKVRSKQQSSTDVITSKDLPSLSESDDSFCLESSARGPGKNSGHKRKRSSSSSTPMKVRSKRQSPADVIASSISSGMERLASAVGAHPPPTNPSNDVEGNSAADIIAVIREGNSEISSTLQSVADLLKRLLDSRSI